LSPDHQFVPPLPGTSKSRGGPIGFAEARIATDRAEAAQRLRAALTVADHATDVGDCRELLSMLGLSARGSGT
jgi:hypothetical protein